MREHLFGSRRGGWKKWTKRPRHGEDTRQLGTSSFFSLRENYKSFPYLNPGVPEQKRIWRPVLTVQIIHNHAKSKRFDAIVDSGSDYCLFDANIGASIGIKIISGPEGPLGGNNSRRSR
jgi:hypothetical protein